MLTALLSSTLCYNVLNVIDERALEQLSFVTQLSKLIAHNEDQYLPNFVWVVRDFALELRPEEGHNVTALC